MYMNYSQKLLKCFDIAVFPFCRNLLEFGNLQEHLEKILSEHNNECKTSMSPKFQEILYV